MTARKLRLTQIRLDGGTQPRSQIDQGLVAEYAEAMIDGADFPPVTVYHDGSSYWLADGFHRYQATEEAGRRWLSCEVRDGTLRDAILHSVGANATHGLRRSNEDKRRAVLTLLRDPEWQQWSDREIAKACDVSRFLVATLKQENTSHTGISASINPSERTFVHPKTGEPTTMNTAGIAQANSERSRQPAPWATGGNERALPEESGSAPGAGLWGRDSDEIGETNARAEGNTPWARPRDFLLDDALAALRRLDDFGLRRAAYAIDYRLTNGEWEPRVGDADPQFK